MVEVADLYVAVFGHEVRRKLESEIRADVIDRWHEDERSTFEINISTNLGTALTISIGRDNWYSPLKPTHYEYSKKHKNYTVIAGNRGREREFFELPSQKALKEHPNYLALQAYQKDFQERRQEAIKLGINNMMISEIKTVRRDFDAIMALTDDTARAYFEKNGWEIDPDVTFTGFRPCGWIMTERPDGYGHQEGTAASVDWEAQKIKVYGWSSSD